MIGLPFLCRRKSALLDGAAADARDLSEHLAAYLDGSRRSRGLKRSSEVTRAFCERFRAGYRRGGQKE